jgi:hypothetical protein
VNTKSVSLVPLQQASLCLDCETITAGHTNCFACGSRALLNLARVLSQHTTGLSSTVAFPVYQRHAFRAVHNERKIDRRLERLSAAPPEFAFEMTRNRRETFES